MILLPSINSSTYASTSDHSQNTPDVSPSLDNGEEKFFTANPFDFSSNFFGNTEGEYYCFSYTPLFDSSDHEDADELNDFSNRSFCGLFTLVFDHDVDFIIVDLSKPPVYDDVFVDKVETP